MPVLEMLGISKSFGAVKALDDVSLSVEKGSIHALVGENGAGKTTLMRILYGATAMDSGTINLNGQSAHISSSAQAISHGIGMVSQHYSIIPELTNLQNLMLGAEPGWTISNKKAASRADELATRMGFSFDWNASASTLSPAGAQKLEILKLLWRNAEIMILDEPTAMLSPADSNALFESLKQLTEAGATVVLVTHRLPEVISHCKEVTVLRGGKFVGSKPVEETNTEELAEMIVGHPLTELAPHQAVGRETARLTLQNLSAKGYRGDLAVNGLSMELYQGELLGIAGVDGNGQRELFQVLTGGLKPESGSINWDGEDITSSTIGNRIAKGFRLIPEDRHAEGVIDDWPLEENAALGLQKQPPFANGAYVDQHGRKGAAEKIAAMFNTKHGGLNNPMSSLSGGNQQRFVAGRVLFLNPQLILAFQPARGLDIDATRKLYDAIRSKCLEGACAIVVSFDLDEILIHCDRVAVMHAGHILNPPKGSEHDRQAIGRLMVGAA
ncbi:MAG TPA: ABC transporter ATP-binding protein [Fimbriimonadaceae bacterium]|jgi:simple sugar transport system ATP-binding protein